MKKNPLARSQLTFETASEHASKKIPIGSPDMSVGKFRDLLNGQSFECASHIVVCEGLSFLGIIRIEDLYSSGPDASLKSLMDAKAPRVAPGLDQEIAAWQAVHHGESALAVVDENNVFHGLIPPQKLLEVILSEHEEDISRLGGYLKRSRKAVATSEEAVWLRFIHRIPWLLIGLGGVFLSATLMESFENKLRDNLVWVFFLPGIIYLSDAVGTQTETVVVRSLSLGVSIRKVIHREWMTGLVAGIALAIITFPLISLGWPENHTAIVVSAAVLAACSTASVVAMFLPLILDKFGLDPALGSGPLGTVIQDLLTILIYFSVIMIGASLNFS